MIIDHDTMTQMGPTDETMPLRVIEPVVPLVPDTEANSGGNGGDYKPWPMPDEDDEVVPVVDYPELEKVATIGDFTAKGAPTLAEWAERKYSERWMQMRRGFHYRYRPSVTGRLSTEHPVGVEQSGDDTGTFALPAVWKMTGKPSANALAHRTAASVQRVFNEAGWPIAVWYGEYTKTYWVMDSEGLHEFETVTSMYQGMGWEAL